MIDDGLLIGVEEYWAADWRGPTLFVVRDGQLHPAPDRGARADLELPGTLFPRLTDHHVHLGLVDAEQLVAGGITGVVDLGWIPEMISGWRTESRFPGSILPDIRFAGGLLSCRGGYPVGDGWAPDGAVIELDAPEEAEAAVSAQISLGASLIKVTLNSEAGPVPDDALLTAIVLAARSNGVPVIAHVEGTGMTRRALDAGVNALAHTPFTERLDTDLIERMSRAGTAVVSTLDIHGWGEETEAFRTAQDNLRRISTTGVRVLYGTDLGNGPLPLGVNARELAAIAGAGIARDALVAAIAGVAQPGPIGPRFAWIPGTPPRSAADTAAWLAGARGTTIDYLEETLP